MNRFLRKTALITTLTTLLACDGAQRATVSGTVPTATPAPTAAPAESPDQSTPMTVYVWKADYQIASPTSGNLMFTIESETLPAPCFFHKYVGSGDSALGQRRYLDLLVASDKHVAVQITSTATNLGYKNELDATGCRYLRSIEFLWESGAKENPSTVDKKY